MPAYDMQNVGIAAIETVTEKNPTKRSLAARQEDRGDEKSDAGIWHTAGGY